MIRKTIKRVTKKKALRKKVSNKGKLVKGYVSPVPIDVLEFSVFHEEMSKMLEGNSGVYVLYNKDKVYYVGITKDLFKRLGDHTKDKHKGKWNRFSVFIIKRDGYLKDIESIIHRIYDAPANVIKGKFKKHYQYDQRIKRVRSEVFRKLERMKRHWD